MLRLKLQFILALWLMASPALAITYGGTGGRPAYPRPDNPRTTDIFVHTLAPGTTQVEGIDVINNEVAAKTLMVYAADSTPSTDGGYACEQLSEPRDDVGAWITFGWPGQDQDTAESLSPNRDEDSDGITSADEAALKTNPREADTDGDGTPDKAELDAQTDPRQPVVITIDPEKKILLPFTITVPTTAGVGEHNGCILIQEKKDTSGTDQGIAISTRTGIRVALTVPGDVIRTLRIVRLDVLPRPPGGKILHPVVRNDGNVSIDATVKVTTKNLFGWMIKEHGGEYAILRETTSAWNFELPPTFWGGWYRSHATVSYDSNPMAELGKKTTNQTTITGPTVGFFLAPSPMAWAVYAAGLGLLLALGLVLWLIAKRRQLIEKTWVRYTIKPNDTIQTLARARNVSWKLLAAANKLKPPFELKRGSHLLVPPTTRVSKPSSANKVSRTPPNRQRPRRRKS